MRSKNEVEALFDSKAKSWNSKYEADGPLANRAAMFVDLAREFFAPDGKILDFGCGTGAIAAQMASLGFVVTACDISSQMLNAGKNLYGDSSVEWSLLPADWKGLPFAPDVFNGIVASSVFEYLDNLDSTLAECRRVLRPGGILIATVPDPDTPIRRLEQVVRPPVLAAASVPLLGRLPKVRSYAAYLKCSRNRLTVEQWVAIARRAQFDVMPMEGRPGPGSALRVLLFRKSEDTAK